MRILILNFSSRLEGNCHRLARVVAEQLPYGAEIVDFRDLEIHTCGRCTYECFRGSLCPRADDGLPGIYERIAAADKTIWILPNYCGYPCANFFAFNERGCGYFAGREDRLSRFLDVPKQFIVVSNSESDTFREAFRYLTREEPEVLFLSTRRYGCGSSLAGDLAQVPGVKEAVAEFLHA